MMWRKRSVNAFLKCLVVALGIWSVAWAFSSTISRGTYPMVISDPSLPSQMESTSRKVCQRNLKHLTETLRNDTETLGLRPHLGFSGLNRQLFSVLDEYRIAFIGDSTLFYLAADFCRMMNYDWKEPLDTLPLSDSLERLKSSRGFSENYQCRTNRTVFSWVGTTGHDDHVHTEKILGDMWTLVEESKPDIMVVNMGLHWLHFYNLARTTSVEAIRRWIHYEDWLSQVYDKALSLNVKMLLYKTTNFVCDDKLYDNYMEANALYKVNDNITMAKCVDSIHSEDPTLLRHAVADYCANGTINNHGSEVLNRRLERFVGSLSSTDMAVAIYNDSGVQQCQFCGERDGLHYHSVNPVRIRLFAHILECLAS